MTTHTIDRTPLARWMFEHGVTGRELALRAKISESTISRLRNGIDVEVDPESIKAVRRVTGLKKL